MKNIITAGWNRIPAVLLLTLVITPMAWGGEWSISLFGGGASFNLFPGPPPPRYQVYGPPPVGYDYYEYEGYPGGPVNPGYYPVYPRPYNPVVEQNVYNKEGVAPDGTYHEEGVVEDRHSSYYSPGRNYAITRPQTTVETWNYGPGATTTRERTTWIGADGRPHSTTVDRNTQADPWGNTRTDTHVELKRRPGGAPFNGQPSVGQSMQGPVMGTQPASPQMAPQRQINPSPLIPMAPPSDEPIKLMPKGHTKQVAPKSPASATPAAPSTNVEAPPAAAPVASW